MSQGIEILCDSHHGQYIPQLMINRLVDNGWQGIEKDDIADLQDPSNEWYWEAWYNIEDNATYTDKNGNVWTLYQNGDLFAICEDLMTEEEKANFFGDY